MDTIMRAAIYTRVSTVGQATEGYSLDTQADQCEKYIASKDGWELVDVFREEGVSGAKASRPKLDKLMRRLDRYDVLVIPRLDRLGRSASHLLEVVETLERNGVALASATQLIDTTDATGKLLLQILAAVAEFERELNRERTGENVSTRALAGAAQGGPAGYGYRWEDGRRVPDPPRDAVVRRIYQERLAGIRPGDIALNLETDGIKTYRGGTKWAKRSVQNILRSTLYRGVASVQPRDKNKQPVGEPIITENAHERLVSDEDWFAVQRLLEQDSKGPGKGRGRRPKTPFLLSDRMLICQCGATMSPRSFTDQYKCSEQTRTKGQCGCTAPLLCRTAVDEAVEKYFREAILDVEKMADKRKVRHEERIARLKSQIKDEQAEIIKVAAGVERLEEHLINGLELAEYHRLKTLWTARVETAQENLKRLQDQLDQVIEMPEMLEDVRERLVEPVRTAETTDALHAALQRVFSEFRVTMREPEHLPMSVEALVGDEPLSAPNAGQDPEIPFITWWLQPVPNPDAVEWTSTDPEGDGFLTDKVSIASGVVYEDGGTLGGLKCAPTRSRNSKGLNGLVM